MERTIILLNREITYNLQRKNVKNINLRIKSDGTISVSANRWVLQGTIESFLISKADFIIKALEKYENKEDCFCKMYFEESEICNIINRICKDVYPYFESYGISYPQIRFKKMVSRWGSCNPQKHILTFNINLMYVPLECVEYVVYHEFTHFLQANHSSKFYDELAKVCPDWKTYRKKLKEINIR